MNVTQKIANKRLRDFQREIPINRKKIMLSRKKNLKNSNGVKNYHVS